MAYAKVTGAFEVKVEPRYLDEQSAPAEGLYVWAYTVVIENRGATPAQLRARYWKITDGNGAVQEVRGPGVVGEQPVIEPGATYTYTSGCPLKTNSGTMVGTYLMQTPEGELFSIDVPAFSLDSPHVSRTVN